MAAARAAGRAAALAGLLLAGACAAPPTGARQEGPMDETAAADARARMVRTQIEARGVTNPRVLAAMRAVPRHRFVPDAYAQRAYEDNPLPIAAGQTISQPYIVAVMSEVADIMPNEVVLEIGTGSGYQAAVLSHLARQVYSIEVVESLAESSAALPATASSASAWYIW